MREVWQGSDLNRLLLIYGGGAILSLGIVLIGSGRSWWWFVAIGFVGLLLLFYFLVVSLWAAYQQYQVAGQREEEVLWQLGRLRPEDQLVHIGLGLRQLPLAIGGRLTSGHLTVVDVYNPQLTPASSLAHRRQRSGRDTTDPRFTWLDGRIELLPLPDHSAKTIILSHTLSQFWQAGDCQQLLTEIGRVLAPGGQLLVAEATRTQTNFWVLGWRGLRLHPAGYWRQLLSQNHFVIKQEAETLGLVYYFVAQKPAPQTMHQLTFPFVQPTRPESLRF